MYAPRFFRRNGPYRVFNFSNNSYENGSIKKIPKNNFKKVVSFSRNKKINYFNKNHPPNYVSTFSTFPIKTKNRFEALSNDIDNNDSKNHKYYYVNPPKETLKEFTSKSNERKYRKLISKRHHSEEEKKVIKYAIEKGPLTIESNKDIECFNVADVLDVYEQSTSVPLSNGAGKLPYFNGRIHNMVGKTLPVQ